MSHPNQEVIMAQDIHQKISQLLRLANLLSKQGAQPEQAIAVAIQACTLASEHLGEEHPIYARCLNDTGMLYESMKDYAKAEQFYFKALTIRRKLYGETHSDIAQSLNNLGAFLLLRSSFEGL